MICSNSNFKMKKLFSFAFATILFGTIFLSSCSKEEEPEPTNTDPRAKFHGHWNISETSSQTGTTPPYFVDITDSSDGTHILFAYLYQYQTKIRATVNDNNLTIPSQVVEGNYVSGSGTLINTNQISLNYLVWLGGANYDTIAATLTK